MGGERRCLVTGGCGFIGSHLCEALAARGCAVRVLDNLSTGSVENLAALGERVELVRADVRDFAAVSAAMGGIDTVFHEAALVSVAESVRRPLDSHAINVGGTLHVLEAARARGVRRVVLASSAAVYGDDPALPKVESMPPRPVSPYGADKLAAEHYLRVFARLHGVGGVALRYFNVYGPRQRADSEYSGVISRFADALARGDAPTVYGDGRQTRDFVFVADVVRANLLAMDAPPAADGEPVNVGSGRATSLLDLLGTMARLAGRAVAPRFAPARAGDIRDSLGDLARARQLLGYAPAHDLASGLAALLGRPAGPPS